MSGCVYEVKGIDGYLKVDIERTSDSGSDDEDATDESMQDWVEVEKSVSSTAASTTPTQGTDNGKGKMKGNEKGKPVEQ
jgi:hypothetical protein